MSLISDIYSTVPSAGLKNHSDPPVRVKVEQPNFVRRKTRGMTAKQNKIFKRMQRVNAGK